MSEVERVAAGGLKVAKILHDFVVNEVIPGTGIEAASFWQGLDGIVHNFAPRNRALLQKRDALQAKIDDWYRGRRAQPFDEAAHKRFLADIGYLVPEGPSFKVDTANVDEEIAAIAGPQLVVPVSNARYALNAANARWGSLYDALYGSDAIPRDGGAGQHKGYDPARGKLVIAWARRFLDAAVPLASGSHADVRSYAIDKGALAATLQNGNAVGLKNPKQLRGDRGSSNAPTEAEGTDIARHRPRPLDSRYRIIAIKRGLFHVDPIKRALRGHPGRRFPNCRTCVEDHFDLHPLLRARF